MAERVVSVGEAAPTRVRRVRSLALVLVSGTLAATVAVVTERAPASSELTTVTLLPLADAYVDSMKATRNYGKQKKLTADASSVRQIFMRFDLTGLRGPVQEARLRIRVRKPKVSASAIGGSVARVAETTWSETGVTYDNRPTSLGPSVATLGAVKANTWVEVPVTSAVTTGRLLTLAVRSTSNDAAIYESREAGANAPQLIVTTGTNTSSSSISSSSSSSSTTSSTTTTTTTTPPAGVVIAAAGDLVCPPGLGVTATSCRQLQVSNLVANDPSVQHFLALGDLQYDNGELANFQSAYAPSYGRFKTKTKPVPGNHEYQTPGASGYYSYFGAAAGDPAKGYYSFNIGTDWRVVMLNSSCGVVSCASTSVQTAFLTYDLAATARPCVVAAWHHPRFSSGQEHGNHTSVGPFWDVLQQVGADIVLSGHEHNYERFAPQLPSGAASANGIREFVVGTGGRSLYSFATPQPNSVVRLQTFGVLKLTLGNRTYSWRFVGENGAVLDSGTGTCH